MLIPRLPQQPRVMVAFALVAICLAGSGCSRWSASRLFDFKSFSRPSLRTNTAVAAKERPLSNAEQRKLCIATAEQLAQSQHWAEAAQLFEKAEALGKPGQYLDRELAPVLAGNGQYAEALERYKRLMEKNPNDAALEINFAWTLMEAGNLTEAEEHLRNVLRREPANSAARMNLGLLCAKCKRTNEAFDMFASVVGETAAHHNIGVVLLDQGDVESAKVAFAHAASGPNSNPQSQQFLAALAEDKTDGATIR